MDVAPVSAPDPAALPAPGDPSPLGAGPPAPPSEVVLETSAEELEQWRARLTAAREVRDSWRPIWEANLDKCQPTPQDLGQSRDKYDVDPKFHFRTVRQKLSQLWHGGAPEVVLEARLPEQMAGDNPALYIHQAFLNLLLGSQAPGLKVGPTVKQQVLDALTVGGMGWAQIGWDKVLVSVPPPADLAADPTIGAAPIQVPIYEAPFWRRFPPASGLKPEDAEGTDPDAWPWIAIEYTLPPAAIRSRFPALPPDVELATSGKAAGRIRDRRRGRRGVKEVTVTEIHYLAHRTNRPEPQARHPQIIYELVLIDGVEDKPARHRPCPYQTLDTATGQLTPDSVVGYTICPYVLRPEVEGTDVQADATVIGPLAEEVGVFRSQMIRHRDASMPVVMFKESTLSREQVDILRANDYFNWTVVPDADWPPGQPPILLAANPSLSRDSFASQDVLERDMNAALALNENSNAQASKSRRTATETQTVSAQSAARASSEQGDLSTYVATTVGKLDAIVRRYYASPVMVSWIGPQGHPQWAMWTQSTLSGPVRYTLRPDSQVYVDAQANQARWLQLFNQTFQAPGTNQQYLLRQTFKAFGQDPTQAVLPPQPPPPPQPKISASIKMEDFLGPAAPIAAKLVTGQPVTPEDIAMMESLKAAMPPPEPQPGESNGPTHQEHPGPAPKTEPVDAHQSRRTGGIEGVGVV